MFLRDISTKIVIIIMEYVADHFVYLNCLFADIAIIYITLSLELYWNQGFQSLSNFKITLYWYIDIINKNCELNHVIRAMLFHWEKLHETKNIIIKELTIKIQSPL